MIGGMTGAVQDARIAIAAALAGAAVVRQRFGTTLARVQKSGHDFATVADIESEHAIIATILAACPGDAVLGEESGRVGAEQASRVWLVDPLCGTINYAAQTPPVAVNVALRTDEGVRVAASADPFGDEVFWTDGEHAWVRRGGVDEPLAPSAGSRLVEVDLNPPAAERTGWRLIGSAGFDERFRARFMSTTLPVAWVAAGRRAALLNDGDMRDSVHFAAGIAICQAAGCVVTGVEGQPLHTGVGGLLVAADEATHETLLALIRSR
jgi:myo-inositol-1(or 4)-monophosphatase